MRNGQGFRLLSGEKKVDSAAKSVDVAGCGGFASELFGGKIRVLAHNSGSHCFSDLLSDIEVDQFNHVLVVEHGVIRGKIPVHYRWCLLVQVGKNATKLQND